MLNLKIFDIDVEKLPIRQGFGEGLLEAGRRDERVVALCADLTDSVKMDLFKKEFPKRFFEMGIQEQSMASVASGMAAMGKIPFIASYAMFSPGRNWEQIRTTICYNNMPVKIAGAHAGVSVGPDGGTHQAIEDIALMRVIPNMTVIVPCDSLEAKKATLALAVSSSPSYIRLAREKSPIVTREDTPFEIGKAMVLYESSFASEKKVGIIACGQMVAESLFAAKILEKEGISVGVMNLATIKPLDGKAILSFAKTYGKIITAEEHQKAGGMGSAVSEFLSENHPTKIAFVGIHDAFGQSGTPDELFAFYGLDKNTIVQKAQELLENE